MESRVSIAVTVAWMLSCMSTAIGMIALGALRLLMASLPSGGGRHPLANMASVLLLTTMATGMVCLILTPVVLRIRGSRPPPRTITIAAVMIGMAPLVTIAAMALTSQL